MKTIMLLRHAKSSWDDSSLKDFDRPLAKRGQKDAPRIGRFIHGTKSVPAAIISSPAERAKQTVQFVAAEAKISSDLIQWNEDLYYGGARDYLSAIQKVPENVTHIMLVGHNPLLEETVSLLCNNEGAYGVRMPTAGLVCIEHPAIQWEQVRPGTARLKWIMIPKLLKKLGI